MKSANFLTAIPFQTCKSVFALRHPGAPTSLEQYQRRDRFFAEHDCHDVGHIDDGQPHEAITLTINQDAIDLEDLRDLLISHANRARRWLYVDINKFLVYARQPVDKHAYPDDTDPDLKLIKWAQSVLSCQMQLVRFHYRLDDRGHLGNFMHPVTNLVFQRHG